MNRCRYRCPVTKAAHDKVLERYAKVAAISEVYRIRLIPEKVPGIYGEEQGSETAEAATIAGGTRRCEGQRCVYVDQRTANQPANKDVEEIKCKRVAEAETALSALESVGQFGVDVADQTLLPEDVGVDIRSGCCRIDENRPRTRSPIREHREEREQNRTSETHAKLPRLFFWNERKRNRVYIRAVQVQ